mgnify:CR=1 FL=1
MSLAIRIIPVLLLRNRGLEKSIKFTDFKYVGCAVNAARVFSNRNADELILLDTLATSQDRRPHLDIVKEIADETFMPFTVGGGISDVSTAEAVLAAGAACLCFFVVFAVRARRQGRISGQTVRSDGFLLLWRRNAAGPLTRFPRGSRLESGHIGRKPRRWTP